MTLIPARGTACGLDFFGFSLFTVLSYVVSPRGHIRSCRKIPVRSVSAWTLFDDIHVYNFGQSEVYPGSSK